MSGIIRHSATSGAKVISICKQPRVHCPRGYTRRRSSAMGGGPLLEIGSEARQSKIQVQGDVAQTPLITAHQRELLLECARAFNDVPRAAITGIEPARQRGARPGDEFNTKAPGMTFWRHAAGQRLGGGETLPGGSPSACHRSGTSRFWERLLDAARTLALIKSRIFCSIYRVTRFSNHGFARQGNLSC